MRRLKTSGTGEQVGFWNATDFDHVHYECAQRNVRTGWITWY